jgi:hypothetical protein
MPLASANYRTGAHMLRSKLLFPSVSFLNHTACAQVWLVFVALLGLIFWMIVDFEMPLIAAHLHR